jgi:hypothetical protein
LAALVVVLTQELAGLSIDEMYLGAGRTDDRPVLVFGNIWIVVQLVLDVETGRRTPENEMAHLSEFDDPATPSHDLAQGFRRDPVLAPIGAHPGLTGGLPRIMQGLFWRGAGNRSRAFFADENSSPRQEQNQMMTMAKGTPMSTAPPITIAIAKSKPACKLR